MKRARGGGRKAFVTIGRAVTDAIRSDDGDAAHWAWIEWRSVRSPLAFSEAKKAGDFSVMGRSGTIRLDVFDKIAKRMTLGDPVALNALRRWRAQKGFPSTNEVPIRDLVLASLEADANE